jgi:Spy/CpxP family protein refolding chaperone
MLGINGRKLGIGVAVAGLVGAMFAGCGHRAGRGHFWSHHRQHSLENPDEVREHVEDAAEWMLGKVDATEQQTAEVQTILDGSVEPLMELARQHRAHRKALIDIFSAPEIDRQQLEELRLQEMQVADAASSRLLQTLADAAEVLSPKQRRGLADRAGRFHH